VASRKRRRAPTFEQLEIRLVPSATVWTDKLDYHPDSTAVINASGFAIGETVRLQVLHTDGKASPGDTPWCVTDGGAGDLDGRADGHIQTTWHVGLDCAGATLHLTANGLTSGEIAQETFTDGTVTVATGGSAISADTNTTNGTATWTALTGPNYTEATGGDASTGTIVLNAPSGFVFDTSGTAPTVLVAKAGGGSGTNINGAANGGTSYAMTSISSTQLTFTIALASSGQRSSLTWQNVRIRPSAATPLASGNITKSGTSTMVGVTAGITNFGTLTEVAGATKAVTITPSTTTPTAGSAFSVTVTTADQFGNATTGATVHFSSTDSQAVLPANYTFVAADNGSHTFTNGVTLKTAGNQTLTVTYTGNSAVTATTGTISVSAAAAASKVVFGQQPTNATAGVALSPAVTVKVEDTFGNVVTGDNSTVTLTLSSGTFEGGFTTATAAASSGVATFSTLKIDVAGSYTLSATDGALTGATSNAFTISAAAASQLVITTQPSNSATAGTAFATQPIVKEEDQYGNVLVSDSTHTVTAARNLGTGTLQGTLTVTLASGVATFSNLSYQVAETMNIKFTTNAGAFTATSNNVAVSPAAASKLVFGQQPSNAISGTAIGPAVTVKVEDTYSNVVTSNGSTVTLTLSSGTFEGGSTTAATAASSGVATFSTLKIDVAGSYTLSATDGVLTGSGPSNSFTISAATTTGIASSANPSVYGQLITFTATVTNTSASGGLPTGAVEFFDGATDLGAGTALSGTGSSATSSIKLSSFAAGSHSITAVFTPTGIFVASSSTALTQTVNKASLTVTANSATKTYGSSITFAGTEFTTSGLVSGDTVTSVTLTSIGAPATATVAGSPYTIVPSNAIGSGLTNYTITFNNGTLTVSPKALTASITASNKTYDATTAATITSWSLTGVVGTDDVSLAGGAALFADKNVGVGKVVTATGFSLTGAAASNYTVNTAATTTANISARLLTVSAAGVNKVYDGTAAATVTLSDNRVSGDVFTDSYTSASFNNKNVATAKSVSVSGISISGTDASNYTFNATASTTADITARALTVSAQGVNKVYDGTTGASVALTDDRVAGDDLTDSYSSATFADKNVGTGKVVSVSGIAISGTDAGNYTFNPTASTTADITPRALTISATGVSKVYDGTTDATVTLSDDRVSGDDLADSYGSTTFADKNVGTGKAVTVSGISISGSDAGNYAVSDTTASATADITARALTISATGVNKVYDATTDATVTLTDDRIAGDDLTDSYSSATFADKNVGTGKAVTVNGVSISGSDAGNYALSDTSASATADITARTLTISATGLNKVYDGTTDATVTLSDNRIAGDDLTDSYGSAAFADRNVGTGKGVSVSGISISGTDAGNYTFNPTATTTADITPRALTVSATAVSKVYDGTTDATVTLSDDRVSGDDLVDSYGSATFADKNVGTGKAVTVSGISISGSDAANYTFNPTASTTADITARTLTVSATGVSKVYDGTAGAAVTLSDDRVSGDDLTDSYSSATFADKNVGSGKAVSVSGIAISGTDAGNYTFNPTASTTADITPRALAVSATGVSKVYEGTTAATVTLSDNRLAGDDLTDSYSSAAFADKNVGTGKTISVNGIAVSGTDAGNYTFDPTASATADITARTLTVTAQGVNKVYDGTTGATVTLTDNRVAGDDLTDGYGSATFTDKNVGSGKTVSVNGISISGTDAGNYALSDTSATTTADIATRALTVTAHGVNKVYNGTNGTTVTLSDNRIASDLLTDSYSSATFADRNVGTAKPVNVSGISISGSDAGNYALSNTTATTTANISARSLTVTASGFNKVYDGTTGATVTLSDNRVAGDLLTDSYSSATFADKNVGAGKVVSVSGISISGTDAGNYTFNPTASTTADITARTLTVTASGVNRVYDGTTAATVTLTDDRVAGDDLTNSYSTATFADKNVGTGEAVSVSGIAISGSDAGNYALSNTTATTTANISARSLTVTASGVNKVYDGTTATTVTLSDNRVAGDDLTDSYAGASFANKNVGTGKTVSVTGISISGTDAGNYVVNTTTTTSANIAPRALTITAIANTKPYDGTAGAAAAPTVVGLQVGDTVSGAAETYGSRHAGTGKTLSVTSYTLNDGNGGHNYLVTLLKNTTGVINKAPLTIAATTNTKNYDGTTSAAALPSIAGLKGVDSVTGLHEAYADPNVGTGKTLLVTGYLINDGNSGGDYAVATVANSTGVITLTTATIGGTVFQDININGVQDPGEPGLRGQTVFLDLNGSGTLATGDPVATTDSSGNYQFTVSTPGTYTVRPVLLGGELLGTPATGSYQVTLTSAVNVAGRNFAEVPTSITVPLTLPLSTPFLKQGNANADFVEAVYRAVLDRDAEPAGLAHWTGLLNDGTLSRLQVVQGIRTSIEHFNQEVTDFYFTFLGRAPEPAGLQSWVQALQNGLTEEQMAFDFLDSPEYLSKGDKYFVDRMYLSLLGREFDPSGEASWLNALGDDVSGNPTHTPSLTHEQVITEFLRSPESLNRLVEGYYQVFLQRLAEPQGLNSWMTALQGGGSFLTIGQQFLSSDEFYNNAAAHG
jgi:hypothetical protein